MIRLTPVRQKVAFEFVAQHHRHHPAPRGSLWQHAVSLGCGEIVGVCIVGRPVARALDDGFTMEVTRCCTLGARNACSMLYGAARRVALSMGYRRGQTYILDGETGASLRAAGWRQLGQTEGRSWNCPSRPRTDKHPTGDKQRWGFGDWPVEVES